MRGLSCERQNLQTLQKILIFHNVKSISLYLHNIELSLNLLMNSFLFPTKKSLYNLVFSVNTGNYGSLFFPVDLWPARFALGHKSTRRKSWSVTYSTAPKKRLVRVFPVIVDFTRASSNLTLFQRGMNNILYSFEQTHTAFTSYNTNRALHKFVHYWLTKTYTTHLELPRGTKNAVILT